MSVPGSEVWVAETWEAHGEGHSILGVYATREAAFTAFKALENMTVYVDVDGDVRARPRNESPKPVQFVPCNHPAGPQNCPCGGRGHRPYPPFPAVPVRWGHARAMRVQPALLSTTSNQWQTHV